MQVAAPGLLCNARKSAVPGYVHTHATQSHHTCCSCATTTCFSPAGSRAMRRNAPSTSGDFHLAQACSLEPRADATVAVLAYPQPDAEPLLCRGKSNLLLSVAGFSAVISLMRGPSCMSCTMCNPTGSWRRSNAQSLGPMLVGSTVCCKLWHSIYRHFRSVASPKAHALECNSPFPNDKTPDMCIGAKGVPVSERGKFVMALLPRAIIATRS